MSIDQTEPAAPAKINAENMRECLTAFQEALARAMRERYHGSVSITVGLAGGRITHMSEDGHKTRRFSR